MSDATGGGEENGADSGGEDGGTNGGIEERDHDRVPARSGKALLVVVFVLAVSVAGGFGYLVGSIGPRALGAVGLFGVTIFRPTPVGMAVYGMTITGLVLGVLYVGARAAVRREERPSGDG